MLKTLNKYKYDILILASILAISFLAHIHSYFSFYNSGVKSSAPFIFWPSLFIYAPITIVILLIALIRIFFYIKYPMKLLISIITVFFAILILIGNGVIAQPSAVYFLKGYEKWVKKNVEIDKIQEWLVSGEADKYMPNSYLDNFPDDLPDFMENFDRQHILFNEQKSGRGKSIEFIWGSAFGHWGIVIGMPTSDIQQDGVIKESESYYEYRRSIKPGIYIYDGG